MGAGSEVKQDKLSRGGVTQFRLVLMIQRPLQSGRSGEQHRSAVSPNPSGPQPCVFAFSRDLRRREARAQGREGRPTRPSDPRRHGERAGGCIVPQLWLGQEGEAW